MDFLRLSEIPHYLDACSAEYRPLGEVLIACGLRISEALELTWTQVDLEGSALFVTGSRKLGRRSGEVSGGTKGDRFRGVEFGPRIERTLRDLRARQGEHGAADPRARPVFLGADGQRLDRRKISRGEHKHALRDAGLRRSIRLHDLRHTAAASWLAAGLPLIYVQRQLGHASITTTERQYGHLEKGFRRAPRSEPRRPSGRAARTQSSSCCSSSFGPPPPGPKWSGSQVRARMWCADTLAPPRRAGASSPAARTTACRPERSRARRSRRCPLVTRSRRPVSACVRIP